jgi:hypothetical protein
MENCCYNCLYFKKWDEEGKWGRCIHPKIREPLRGNDYCYFFISREGEKWQEEKSFRSPTLKKQ